MPCLSVQPRALDFRSLLPVVTAGFFLLFTTFFLLCVGGAFNAVMYRQSLEVWGVALFFPFLSPSGFAIRAIRGMAV